MRKQKGSFLIGLVTVLVIFAVIGLTLLSFANTAVDYEADIDKFDKSSQNTLSNYNLTIAEKIQLPERYKADFLEVLRATFGGRYGPEGSKATFQWIQERNIPFDNALYKDISIAIQAGRAEFKASQDRKLEICADYTKYTVRPINKFILGLVGFPSDDIPTKCRIVLDASTQKDFATGTTKPIDLSK